MQINITIERTGHIDITLQSPELNSLPRPGVIHIADSFKPDDDVVECMAHGLRNALWLASAATLAKLREAKYAL